MLLFPHWKELINTATYCYSCKNSNLAAVCLFNRSTYSGSKLLVATSFHAFGSVTMMIMLDSIIAGVFHHFICSRIIPTVLLQLSSKIIIMCNSLMQELFIRQVLQDMKASPIFTYMARLGIPQHLVYANWINVIYSHVYIYLQLYAQHECKFLMCMFTTSPHAMMFQLMGWGRVVYSQNNVYMFTVYVLQPYPISVYD